MTALKNSRALGNFVEHWRTAITANGNFTFEAKVRFEFSTKVAEHETTCMIQLAGYEGGKVSLTETPTLTIDRFHLDFTPEFQDYFWDNQSCELVITGKSGKMGGSYRVVIKPAE